MRLSGRSAGLIYVHFGAFGQKGPEKDFPGFDIASFWAKSGTLVEWTLADDKPFKPQPGFWRRRLRRHHAGRYPGGPHQAGTHRQGEHIQTSLYPPPCGTTASVSSAVSPGTG